jgi:hypothetical protein
MRLVLLTVSIAFLTANGLIATPAMDHRDRGRVRQLAQMMGGPLLNWHHRRIKRSG